MLKPKRVIFENSSLDYEMGKNIFNQFKDKTDVEIINLLSST